MSPEVVVSLVTLFGVAVTGYLSLRAESKKADNDRETRLDTRTEAWIQRLEARIVSLEHRATQMEAGIVVLSAQIRRLGHEPEWTLDDNT